MNRVPAELVRKALDLIYGSDTPPGSVEIIRPEDIRSAYRKRAMEFHPDRANALGLDSLELEEAFKRLLGAFRLLDGIAEGKFVIDRPGANDGRVSGTRSGTNTSGFRAADSAGGATQGGPYRGGTSRSGTSSGGPKHTEHKAQHQDFTSRRNGHGQSTSYRSYAPAGKGYHEGPIPQRPLRFAQFLYYAGLIDWQTMINAITWQMHVRPKIGEIGRAYRFFDHQGIIEVIRTRQIGELFGDVALRLGMVNRLQLNAMVGKQINLNLPIGRYFLEEELFTRTELANLLDKNRRFNTFVRRSVS